MSPRPGRRPHPRFSSPRSRSEAAKRSISSICASPPTSMGSARARSWTTCSTTRFRGRSRAPSVIPSRRRRRSRTSPCSTARARPSRRSSAPPTGSRARRRPISQRRSRTPSSRARTPRSGMARRSQRGGLPARHLVLGAPGPVPGQPQAPPGHPREVAEASALQRARVRRLSAVALARVSHERRRPQERDARQDRRAPPRRRHRRRRRGAARARGAGPSSTASPRRICLRARPRIRRRASRCRRSRSRASRHARRRDHPPARQNERGPVRHCRPGDAHAGGRARAARLGGDRRDPARPDLRRQACGPSARDLAALSRPVAARVVPHPRQSCLGARLRSTGRAGEARRQDYSRLLPRRSRPPSCRSARA
jgi:hypothetical protein